MIVLDVDEKCHDCPLFECDTRKRGHVEADAVKDTINLHTTVVITCKHKKYCTYLKER